MDKHYIHLIALLALLAGRALGQEAEADSQKTYQMREVVVTATRSEILLKDSPLRARVITVVLLRFKGEPTEEPKQQTKWASARRKGKTT